MKLHVLILTWKGIDKIKALKSGLYKNLEKTGLDYQVCVRDNGSDDDTLQELLLWDHSVVLPIKHNRDNYSQGMNSLASLCKNNIKEDIYLLLNNDVEFNDNVSLKNMLDLFKVKDVAVVGARLKYKNTNLLQHAGVIFGPRYGNMPYHFRHKEESDKDAEKNRFFQCVTGAVQMVKAEEFWNVGGFCEKLVWSFDDIDLNLAIGATGKRIAYCGQTNIYHEESASLKINPVNRLYMQHNVNYFKSKWSGKYKLDHEIYLNNKNYNLI